MQNGRRIRTGAPCPEAPGQGKGSGHCAVCGGPIGGVLSCPASDDGRGVCARCRNRQEQKEIERILDEPGTKIGLTVWLVTR